MGLCSMNKWLEMKNTDDRQLFLGNLPPQHSFNNNNKSPSPDPSSDPRIHVPNCLKVISILEDRHFTVTCPKADTFLSAPPQLFLHYPCWLQVMPSSVTPALAPSSPQLYH